MLNACYQYLSKTPHCLSKQNVVFFYSLLVSIMYIILNKAMFIVIDIPSPYIRNNINSINTTSNLPINRGLKVTHTFAHSHFLYKLLYNIIYKKSSTLQKFLIFLIKKNSLTLIKIRYILCLNKIIYSSIFIY